MGGVKTQKITKIKKLQKLQKSIFSYGFNLGIEKSAFLEKSEKTQKYLRKIA